MISSFVLSQRKNFFFLALVVDFKVKLNLSTWPTEGVVVESVGELKRYFLSAQRTVSFQFMLLFCKHPSSNCVCSHVYSPSPSKFV